jgi:hypothetical protein
MMGGRGIARARRKIIAVVDAVVGVWFWFRVRGEGGVMGDAFGYAMEETTVSVRLTVRLGTLQREEGEKKGKKGRVKAPMQWTAWSVKRVKDHRT